MNSLEKGAGDKGGCSAWEVMITQASYHVHVPQIVSTADCCPLSISHRILVFCSSLFQFARVTTERGCVHSRHLIYQQSCAQPRGSEAVLGGELLNLNLPGPLLSLLREQYPVRPAWKGFSQHVRRAGVWMCRKSSARRARNSQGTVHGGTALGLQTGKAERTCPALRVTSPATEGRGGSSSLAPGSLTRQRRARRDISVSHTYAVRITSC